MDKNIVGKRATGIDKNRNDKRDIIEDINMTLERAILKNQNIAYQRINGTDKNKHNECAMVSNKNNPRERIIMTNKFNREKCDTYRDKNIIFDRAMIFKALKAQNALISRMIIASERANVADANIKGERFYFKKYFTKSGKRSIIFTVNGLTTYCRSSYDGLPM